MLRQRHLQIINIYFVGTSCRTIPLQPVDIGANADILAMLGVPRFIGQGSHFICIGSTICRFVNMGVRIAKEVHLYVTASYIFPVELELLRGRRKYIVCAIFGNRVHLVLTLVVERVPRTVLIRLRI